MDHNYLNKDKDQAETNVINNINSLIYEIPDFIGQWNIIENTWGLLGFTKHEDNQQKVDDFRWINTQFTYFVQKKQDEIAKNIGKITTLKRLIDNYSKIKPQPKSEGWTPRYVVALAMKNSWLSTLAEHIKILDDINKEE